MQILGLLGEDEEEALISESLISPGVRRLLTFWFLLPTFFCCFNFFLNKQHIV
jgi:hypothetical protein